MMGQGWNDDALHNKKKEKEKEVEHGYLESYHKED